MAGRRRREQQQCERQRDAARHTHTHGIAIAVHAVRQAECAALSLRCGDVAGRAACRQCHVQGHRQTQPVAQCGPGISTQAARGKARGSQCGPGISTRAQMARGVREFAPRARAPPGAPCAQTTDPSRAAPRSRRRAETEARAACRALSSATARRPAARGEGGRLRAERQALSQPGRRGHPPSQPARKQHLVRTSQTGQHLASTARQAEAPSLNPPPPHTHTHTHAQHWW